MDSRTLLTSENLQSVFDENAVLIEERDDIGDGTECDEIKALPQIRVFSAEAMFPAVFQEGVADFEGDTNTRKFLNLNR